MKIEILDSSQRSLTDPRKRVVKENRHHNMKYCVKCNTIQDKELCNVCARAWETNPVCSVCDERQWNYSHGGYAKKPYVFDGRFMCLTCYNNRFVPADGVCRICRTYAVSFNRSFGACIDCWQTFRDAEIIKNAGVCKACNTEVRNVEDWRWYRELQMLVCRVCYNGNERSVRRVGFEPTPRRLRRQSARDRLLPADRVCSVCKQFKPNSRQWVVEGRVAMCKGCWQCMKS